jgi:hypothetical protein
VLAHPTFTAKVFGANDRLVMGIIGAGGVGRGEREKAVSYQPSAISYRNYAVHFLLTAES